MKEEKRLETIRKNEEMMESKKQKYILEDM